MSPKKLMCVLAAAVSSYAPCAMMTHSAMAQATTNPAGSAGGAGGAGGSAGGSADAAGAQGDGRMATGWTSEAAKMPVPASAWWPESVFYQVFVRSFADSTSGPLANDGIGDIQGLIERLDYLNDGRGSAGHSLGVTALWLMPMHPSPSYHGYDVTDYYGINPQYGTMDDFRRLVKECHKRGIRVVIDLVLNHCSSEHAWFRAAVKDPASAEHGFFIWSDTKPTWKGPWGQNVWHRARDAGGSFKEAGGAAGAGPYYYGLFSPVMPDLDYRNEAVTKAQLEMCRFWLEDVGIDGFRLDAIRHLIEDGQVQENTPATHRWLQRFHEAVASAPSGGVVSGDRGVGAAFTVGEVWTASRDAATYVGDQLEYVFNFDLAAATLGAALHGRGSKLRATLERDNALFPTARFATFLANHDQPRALTQLIRGRTDGGPGDSNPDPAVKGGVADGPARAMAGLAATIQFALPGVPFVYYGEEIGMVGDKPDENIRTPMQWRGGEVSENAGFTGTGVKPWRAVNGDAGRVNVASQLRDPASLLNLYRRLVALRRGTLDATPEFGREQIAAAARALTRGGVITVEASSESVISWARTSDEGCLLFVANLSGAPIAEYALTLMEGSLVPRAAESARELLHGAGAVTVKLTPLGRFAGYRPVDRLEARTGYFVWMGK